MSVLIKGMEKPEHCGYCRFRYDGICHALQKTQYSMNECPLVVIDDAGLNDTISRQAAMDEMSKQQTYKMFVGEDTVYLDANDVGSVLASLPSAQSERKTGRWIDYTEDGYVECPFCHSATNCDENKDELHFCFSCGADMRGEQNG